LQAARFKDQLEEDVCRAKLIPPVRWH